MPRAARLRGGWHLAVSLATRPWSGTPPAKLLRHGRGALERGHWRGGLPLPGPRPQPARQVSVSPAGSRPGRPFGGRGLGGALRRVAGCSRRLLGAPQSCEEPSRGGGPLPPRSPGGLRLQHSFPLPAALRVVPGRHSLRAAEPALPSLLHLSVQPKFL